ncbi:MAG: tail fiber domain-containing protein [Methylococcaceae bacterium]|nr:tail fiber domain-containing protein [Methylococcaceae bacterium]
MTRKSIFPFPLAFLVLLEVINPCWSAPPNPTLSDSFGNTAGGTGALLNTTGDPMIRGNTGFGEGALSNNVAGYNNTAVGSGALTTNKNGVANTSVGTGALGTNTGNNNVAIGVAALNSNSVGFANTAVGTRALGGNTIGRNNTVLGFSALSGCCVEVGGSLPQSAGNNNTASGSFALYLNTGSNNTAIGYQAFKNKTTGNGNLALGVNAGLNLTSGDSNIYIANTGVATESSTIRIGSTGHARTFIGGIRGKTTTAANAVPVLIDANGQLGTANSSVRYKKEIQDMNDASRKLLELRPVTYRYKQADESGANSLEYGLIAEEVVKVYPDLVAYGADGKIETVQYQKLTPMLLNEFQKQAVIIKQQQTEIAALKTQAKKMEDLKQQVSALKAEVADFNLLSARLAKIEAQPLVGWNK